MLISIITPYYKGIHYLKDAFESIRHSLAYCENNSGGKVAELEMIIVLDDGDVKREKKMSGVNYLTPEEYKQEAIRLIDEYIHHFEVFQKNHMHITICEAKGETTVAKLRNIGVSHAHGKYVYFMDSDDYIAEKTLSAMISAAKKEKYDIITGPIEKSSFKYDTYMGEHISEQSYNKDFIIKSNMVNFDFTALNILISREYLHRISDLEFEEQYEVYADMPYTSNLLSRTDNICILGEMTYIKRLHNDSIQYPSLNQGKAAGSEDIYKTRLNEIINTYNKCASFLSDAAHEILKNKKKAIKKARIMQVKNFFRRPTFLFRMIEKFVFRRLGMKDNWVVFESFLGKNYSDSCKYLYEYMMGKYKDKYKYIWVVNNKKTHIQGNIKKVKYLSLGWFYYTSRAKYYVNNMRQPIWMNRRPGSIMLETWHGTPLKKLVFDMDDIHAATPTYKMDMYKQSRAWTYLISDNSFSTDVFESCFLYPRENILETGYPRNDILYRENKDEIAQNIKEKLGIPSDKKVILYAPTWRDDEYYGPAEYRFALKLDMERWRETFGEEYVMLLRMHYFIADAMDMSEYKGFAYDVSRYNDIAELYLAADICVTDYSSVFFDYANLKRPILFYVYDFEKYKDKLRGFYIDMENDLPGPLLYSENELIDAIKGIDDICEKYSEKYAAFYDRFCSKDDGNASKRVADIVFNKK